MESEFDKEINSLLRQAARSGEVVFAAAENPHSAHLDADEISLFAENLLPAAHRSQAIKHLADCSRCRKILAEFVALDAESQVSETSTVGVTVASAIPWYKKLFAFPSLGYAMGALALVFSGLIAFFVLQNARQSGNASIAQMEKSSDSIAETQLPASAALSSNSNANTALATPSAANSNMTSAILSFGNSNVASPNAPMAIPQNSLAERDRAVSANAANANSAATAAAPRETVTARQIQELPLNGRQAQELPLQSRQNLPYVAPKKDKTDSVSPPAPAAAKPQTSDNDISIAGAENYRVQTQNETSQNSVVQNQQSITPGSQSTRRSSVQNGRAGVVKEEAERADEKKAKARTVESKTAGGKVFKFADGVWYDSAYNNQRPTNIRRGSKEFKALDSNLRSIANQIGGTVIIIWKGTAYRIQ